jgi:hypothetical protein
MNKIFAALTVSLLAAATGCTISTDTMDISSSTLTGTVAGQPWSFKAGHTSAFLSEGEDDYFATLYPTAFTTCGISEPTGPHIIVAIPKVPGDYDMGFDHNMTFVGNDSTNKVAFDGRIVVDYATSTHVVGGLHGYYDGANEVNGQFDVTICAD